MSISRYRPYDAAPLPYEPRPIPYMEARQFISRHHYMRGMSNAATGCYGLFDASNLIGVLAFATPCSEAVRSMPFGPDNKGRVTELHRLVILDVTPPNAESFFIARALNLLKADKPDLWGVVSFADSGQGHIGTIYQASNALYYGPSRGERSYTDADGRTRSRRQCKVNVSVSDAKERGWQVHKASPKHRYFFPLPQDRRQSRQLKSMVRLETCPYPKSGATMNQLSLF